MSALEQRLPAERHTDLLLKVASAVNGWYVATSEIAGEGIHAEREYAPGDILGVAMTKGETDEYGSQTWNLTLMGRKCNHQWRPNAELRKSDDQVDLVAIRKIAENDEITASYAQCSRVLGPRSRMLWEGRDVPHSDLRDYIEKDEKETGDRSVAETGDDS